MAKRPTGKAKPPGYPPPRDPTKPCALYGLDFRTPEERMAWVMNQPDKTEALRRLPPTAESVLGKR